MLVARPPSAGRRRKAPRRAPAPPVMPVAPRVPARPGGHLDVLDGLRAAAIVVVVVVHVATITADTGRDSLLWRMIGNGGVGVPVFFVLSGLLLYRPWARAALAEGPDPAARPYLWRRALRILPAYWVMLAVALPLLNGEHARSAWTWVQWITLTEHFGPNPWWGDGAGPPSLGPIWSLSVEASFYLVLPLLGAVLSRYARRGGRELGVRARRLLGALAAIFVLSLGLTAAIRVSGNFGLLFYTEHLLPRSMLYFAAGMALAVLTEWARLEPAGPAARWGRVIGAMPGWCWLVAACAMVLVATPLATPAVAGQAQNASQYVVNVVLFPIVAIALVTPAAFQPFHPMITAVLANPVMRGLGQISYGVFLWHMVVITGWYEFTGRPIWAHDFALTLTVAAAGSLAIAAVSHYAIELPAQRLRGLVSPAAKRS